MSAILRAVDDGMRSRLTAAALCLAGVLSLPAGGRAQESADDPPTVDVALPADAARPFYAQLGIGTGVRLDGSINASFRIVEEVGLHLDGKPVGAFGGITLAEDVANAYSMQIGVRVGWDLALLSRPDFAIVVSPSVAIAFAFDVIDPSTWAYFLVQPALGAGVLFLDGMLTIWIRPIGVDVYVGEIVRGGWAAVAGATIAL